MGASTRFVSHMLQVTPEHLLGRTLYPAHQCAASRCDLGMPLALPVGLQRDARFPMVKRQVLKEGRGPFHGLLSWRQLGQQHPGDQSACGHPPNGLCTTPVYASLAESRESRRPRPPAVAVGNEPRYKIEVEPLSGDDQNRDRAHVPSPRVLLIGVGTAGGKMVRHIASGLAQSPSSSPEVWAMNTDAQALRAVGTRHQLQLGVEMMKGLGTGGDSALGMSAAAASAGDIAGVMAGPPGICYVVCGAGGGTGGGASPLILTAARAAGHLGVAVITLPFRFEGTRRVRQSQATMAALQTEADMVCAIDQDAFLHQQQNLSMTQAADMAATMALRATQGITNLIQAEAAHLSPYCPSTLHSTLPPAGVVEMLRGSGRTVVAHGSGATLQRAIHLALQASQLGSLDMFAGSLVCVVSSAATLSPAVVADALTRLRGCPGGRSRRVVLATCKEAGMAGAKDVGATVILTGLPHELLDGAAPPKAPSPPIAPTPRRSNAMVGDRHGSFASGQMIEQVAGAPQRRGPRTASPSPLPSSSAVAAAALSHPLGSRDGAQLPPAGGKIVIISAAKETRDEASDGASEDAANGQASVVPIMPAGLEPYTSPLDTPRRQDAVVAPQEQQQQTRRQGPKGTVPPPATASARTLDEPRTGREQGEAPQRSPSHANGSTGVESRAAVPPPSRSAAGTGEASKSAGGRTAQTDTGDGKTPAAAGRVGQIRKEAVSVTADKRGEAQPQKRGAPKGEAVEQRPLIEKDAAAAAASVSVLSGGVGSASLVRGRVDAAAQLDRAGVANAAALAWWREVVEEPAERSKAAAEEAQQQQQQQQQEEDDADDDRGTGVDEGPGSVSSRARAILARERHEEQYRLVRVKQVLPDGSVYEGQMAGTGPHGQGQCVYLNGDVYEGGWRHGMRHGLGRLSEASGDVYDGHWRGGHRHGQGRVEYSEGHVLSARFVDGHVHGPAIIAFGHGSTFYGAFRFNRRQGVAMTVHADGKREWEVWEHGQRVS